ncbi:hypothetical protein L0156_29500 [bacterium]|nr:hypothetical protein [bacterium]
MISRISSIRCSHATAIPSDEGRVYSLVPKAPVTIRAIASKKDTYSDFAVDRFQKYMEYARRAKRDLADNSSLYGYGIAAYAATELIIRA